MRKILIVVLIVFLEAGIVFSQASEKITLSKAVDYALQRNSKIHQYQEKILTKSYDKSVAEGALLPVLNISGSFNRINDPLTFNLDPIRDALISLEANDQLQFQSIKSQMSGTGAITNSSPSYQTYFNGYKAALESTIPHFLDTLKEQQYPAASIQLVQPLFTGMRIISSVKAAKADMDGVRQEMERVKNDIARETIITCLNFIVVNELIGIRMSVLEGMMKHQKNAEMLSEQGMIAKYHLLRAKVAVAEARRNLDSDKKKFDLVNISIKNICCIPDSVVLIMNNSMVYKPVTDSVGAFILLANINQPLLKVVDNNRKMAQQKLNAARGVLYPQVSAFGKYELFPDYLSSLEPDWVVGIQASLALFNGGRNVAGIRSASHLVKEMEQMDTTIKHDVKMWINKSYNDLRTADDRYVHLDADIELAEENLRQCRSRFESGYGTSLEVIDAELVLERNKVDRLVTLSDYYKALTELYTAAGKPQDAISFITGEK